MKITMKYLGPKEQNKFWLNGSFLGAFENTLSTL